MASKNDMPKAASNITAAQAKEWYEKNHAVIERYANGENAFKQLRDFTKRSARTISTFDKETLRTYLQNITGNEQNLRALSWYLYYRSQVYARLVHFYSNMFCLDCRSVVPEYSIVQGGDAQSMLKSYEDTITVLENLRLQQEFYNIYLTCFIQDVFYGVVFYDDTGVFIFPWPAQYARIAGKYDTGEFSYAIDCSYFRSNMELLEYFPDPFQKLYSEYESTREKWQIMPEEYSLCLKYHSEDYETVVGVLAPIFNSLINLLDLEDIQAEAAQLEIYKLIYYELKVLDGTDQPDDWQIDPDLAIKYFNKMVDEAIPDNISAAIVPGELHEISFPNTAASDINKVMNATEAVLNTAGGSEILNGSTINNTYAFRMASIANTEYAISSLLPQTQSWVNHFLQLQLSKPCKVHFFPISVYTKDDYRDKLLESCQNGFANRIAYNTLNGFSERETLALLFFENEVLGLPDKLIPLSTSYTQSANSGDTDPVEGGRPTVPDDELEPSADRMRNQ